MAVNIHNLIASISPDIFCDPSVKDEVKLLVKEKGYRAAAEKAKPKKFEYLDMEDKLYTKSPFDLYGLKRPIEKHILSYDSTGENLEPVYFWLLDSLNSDYKDLKKVEKLTDNFISSPGSGHFSEMGQKTTRMQEEAMKMLGSANQVIKSILNLLYDLKEFKLRLKIYEDYRNAKNKSDKMSALLSLKQVWMDTVDQKRGNTGIKMMAQQYQYVTLIDAFMSAESPSDAEKLDLNDRVKRIIQQRIGEFFNWIEESEKELRKRYEIEKIYLKSQYSTVQLYARWIKPYLKAARMLEQNAKPNAALVTAFNTVIFELTLLGEGEYDVNDDVNAGNLPEMFRKIDARKYTPLILIELNFRSIPERAGQQGYGFRGRVEIQFTSYALNNQELKILKEEIQRDDVGDVISLIENATSESLDKIKDEIEEYLKETPKKENKNEENEDVNPFSALFSFFKSDKKKEDKKEEEDLSKGIKPDSDTEKIFRSQSLLKARGECAKFYGLYKKTHGMPNF
jgi:hypothetical protein